MKLLVVLSLILNIAFASEYTPSQSEYDAVNESIREQKKDAYKLIDDLLKKGMNPNKWVNAGPDDSLLGWVIHFGQKSRYDGNLGRVVYSLKSKYTLKIIKLLLKNGADINQRDKDVSAVTPLNGAARLMVNEIFNLLIEHPTTNVNSFAPEDTSPHFGRSVIMAMIKDLHFSADDYKRITPRVKRIFEKGFVPTGRNFDCEEWWDLTVHMDDNKLEMAKMFHSIGGMTRADVGYCYWKEYSPDYPREDECKYNQEECNKYFNWVGI